MSTPESFVDYVFGIVMTVGGTLVAWIWRRLEKLDDRVDALATKQAGDYLPRSEFDTRIDRLENTITARFDKLDAKVDGKADK